MLRRLTIAAVALILACGLLAATPTAQAAPSFDNSIGAVRASNQVRKGTCAKYDFRWEFRPPTPEWTVLARIRAPKGFSVATQFWDAASPNNLGRTQGKLKIELCGSSIKPGRYKIEMQMIYTEQRVRTTVNRAPTYFRLLRRR